MTTGGIGQTQALTHRHASTHGLQSVRGRELTGRSIRGDSPKLCPHGIWSHFLSFPSLTRQHSVTALDGWPEPFGPENSTEENYVSGGFSTIIILLLSRYDYMFT